MTLAHLRARLSAVALALTAGLLLGCTTPDVAPQPLGTPGERGAPVRSHLFEASYDDVWEAVIDEIADANLLIGEVEKESGVISVPETRYAAAHAHEGTRGTTFGYTHDVVQRHASANVIIRRRGPMRTEVKVVLSMRMQVRKGNGTSVFPFTFEWFDAYSTGKLESDFFANVAARLRPRPMSRREDAVR